MSKENKKKKYIFLDNGANRIPNWLKDAERRRKMSKAILISIKPKWVAKILNGEKTIEIRKTMPKCDLPIEVYIYCTNDKNLLCQIEDEWNTLKVLKGTKIKSIYNGKVVAKFTLNKVEEILVKPNGNYYTNTLSNSKLLTKSCLSQREIFCYTDWHISKIGNYWYGGYVWHISKLVIFDKSKELNEFRVYKPNACEKCWCVDNEDCLLNKDCPKYKRLTKAPQSWCYVEVLL